MFFSHPGGVFALFDSASVNISNSHFSRNSAALGGVTSGQYRTAMFVSGSSFTNNNGIRSNTEIYNMNV